MKYLSVCSGIEAATVAWHPLGWEAFAYSEIEKSPSNLLAHHYPETPNLGDMTNYKEWPDAIIDVLVGGTPCQSFSVAGLRKGLDDARGNLMLTFGGIAARYRAKRLVWENVPGVLSSNGGRDFASFLGLLTGRSIEVPSGRGWGNSGIFPGYKNAYGVAYRVLDAQHFGVPQRRRRVILVGYLGDWRSAAAVLFERHSLSGNPAPSRETGEKVTGAITAGAFSGGAGWRVDGAVAEHFQAVTPPLTQNPHGDNASREGLLIASTGDISHCFNAGGMGRQDYESETMIITPTLTSNGDAHAGFRDEHGLVTYGIPGNWIGRSPEHGGNAVEPMHDVAPCLTKTDQHADAFHHQASSTQSMNPSDISPTLDKSKSPAVAAFKGGQGSKAGGIGYSEDVSPTLSAADSGSNRTPSLMQGMQVRRLTPTECERLQGFPDGYTNVAGLADSARYKALGNSMAVPVMRWIGERINAVDKITGGLDG